MGRDEIINVTEQKQGIQQNQLDITLCMCEQWLWTSEFPIFNLKEKK